MRSQPELTVQVSPSYSHYSLLELLSLKSYLRLERFSTRPTRVRKCYLDKKKNPRKPPTASAFLILLNGISGKKSSSLKGAL